MVDDARGKQMYRYPYPGLASISSTKKVVESIEGRMEEDFVYSHLTQLCQLINRTIATKSVEYLPRQASDLLSLSTPSGLAEGFNCDQLVSVYLPRALLLLSLALLLTLYCVYYRVCVVSVPRVVCTDKRKLAALKKHCPVFFEEFWPTFWAPQAHMQTIIRVAVQTFPKSKRTREKVIMSDGGHVCLDWYNVKSQDQPTVLFLPGITGSSDENYIRHFIQDMTGLGYRSVVFNYRGCGDTKLSTPKLYCGGDIGDLTEILQHIRMNIGEAPLVTVAMSMGSMMLLKYLSVCERRGWRCPIRAVLLISGIWDVSATDKIIHQPLNKYTLNRHLCNNFKAIMKENRSVFAESERKGELCFDFNRAMRCRSFRDFYSVLMFPMFGYKSEEELYHDCSAYHRVDDLRVPIIAFNSADDPFCPPHAIPEERARRNLILITTGRGGHIGFMDSLLPFGKCLMDRVLIQFAQLTLQHNALHQH